MKATLMAGGLVLALFLVVPELTARDEQDRYEPLPPLTNADLKVPTIAQIMQEAHRCRTNYIGQVRFQLGKSDTDWSEVEKKSNDLVRMGQLLWLNNPKKGSRDSWGLFTSVYVANASLLAEAAQKKDKPLALQYQKNLSGMCITCHKAHR